MQLGHSPRLRTYEGTRSTDHALLHAHRVAQVHPPTEDVFKVRQIYFFFVNLIFTDKFSVATNRRTPGTFL